MQKEQKDPKLCDDRGRAFSWHKGKRYYFGVTGTPEAKRAHKRFCAKLVLGEPVAPPKTSRRGPLVLGDRYNSPQSTGIGGILVATLCAEFLKYHSPRLDGSHITHFKYAIEFMVDELGGMPVNEITPKKLRTVRDKMVESGRFCRNQVNNYTTRLIRIFVWGCVEEYVSAAVAGALKLIKPLSKNEPGTFENPKRRNVSDEIIKRTLPFLSTVVAAMVTLQRLLGCRPSEIFNMRAGEITADAGHELWYYIPGHHKCERYYEEVDEEKIIPLGKAEQQLLAPFLTGKTSEQAVFSPRQAVQECPQNSAKRVGEFYNRSSYRTAVQRGIKRANRKFLSEGQKPIPIWTPYQLRHQAATALALAKGRDGDKLAAALLDHASVSTTRNRYIHERLDQRKELAKERVNPFADTPEEGGGRT